MSLPPDGRKPTDPPKSGPGGQPGDVPTPVEDTYRPTTCGTCNTDISRACYILILKVSPAQVLVGAVVPERCPECSAPLIRTGTVWTPGRRG